MKRSRGKHNRPLWVESVRRPLSAAEMAHRRPAIHLRALRYGDPRLVSSIALALGTRTGADGSTSLPTSAYLTARSATLDADSVPTSVHPDNSMLRSACSSLLMIASSVL